jgi:hypothetical protein
MIQDLVKRTRSRPLLLTHFAYSKERPAANETCSHQPQ